MALFRQNRPLGPGQELLPNEQAVTILGTSIALIDGTVVDVACPRCKKISMRPWSAE